MTTRDLKIGVAAALGLLLVTVGAVAGQGPWGGEGRRPGRVVKAALEKLDLTQAQKDKLRVIAEAAQTTMQVQREQRQADRAALRAALETPGPDATAIGNLMIRMKQNRDVARGERQRLHDATLSVLTPEQRNRFEAYLDVFKSMRHRGRETRWRHPSS